MDKERTLSLERIDVVNERVFVLLRLDGNYFSTSCWFPGLDLEELSSQIGRYDRDRLVFHAMLFDLQPFISSGVTRFEISNSGQSLTPALTHLWNSCTAENWAEWRYLNDLPNFQNACLVSACQSKLGSPLRIEKRSNKCLLMFSGGKDSLATSMVMEQARTNFATVFIAHSRDGKLGLQHELVDRVVEQTAAKPHHRAYLFDDYIDSPIEKTDLCSYTGVGKGFAETFSCIFKALLYFVRFGYSELVTGNEAASDESNFYWSRENREVNHQWCKSQKAEQLIVEYVCSQLVYDFQIRSPLRRFTDPEIFAIVGGNLGVLSLCHSCNVQKPWCKNCPKCCYAWICYVGYFGLDFAKSVFGRDLFDDRSLDLKFRELLSDVKPFECVGSRLDIEHAVKLCRSRGVGHETFPRSVV